MKHDSLKRIAVIDIIIGSTGIIFSILNSYSNLLDMIFILTFSGLILSTGIAILINTNLLEITGSIVSYLGIISNAFCFLAVILIGAIPRFLWPAYVISGAYFLNSLGRLGRFFMPSPFLLHISNIVFLFYWIFHLTLIRKAFSEKWLNNAVIKLVKIYNKHPEGFYKDRVNIAAWKVRNIGKKLNQKGGKRLMLKAHAEFCIKCKISGSERNLEIMWDGIGEFRG
jgi:hypothetical protein